MEDKIKNSYLRIGFGFVLPTAGMIYKINAGSKFFNNSSQGNI